MIKKFTACVLGVGIYFGSAHGTLEEDVLNKFNPTFTNNEEIERKVKDVLDKKGETFKNVSIEDLILSENGNVIVAVVRTQDIPILSDFSAMGFALCDIEDKTLFFYNKETNDIFETKSIHIKSSQIVKFACISSDYKKIGVALCEKKKKGLFSKKIKYQLKFGFFNEKNNFISLEELDVNEDLHCNFTAEMKSLTGMFNDEETQVGFTTQGKKAGIYDIS